jgi:hypothetical protein
LYLADAKRVEFRPYESLEEVEGVAVTLEEAVALTDNFVKEMEDRNIIMEQDGAKNLPLNGKVHLKKFVAINGKLVHGDIPVEFKTSDGVTRKDRAKALLERNDVVEVNIPDVGYKVKEQEQPEEEKSSRGGRGGYGGW